MFEKLDELKPALKQLVTELRNEYPYASVLAVDSDERGWGVSRNGATITTGGPSGPDTGFVVRVFDETGCGEYSFNEFSAERIPEICRTIRERLTAQKNALPAVVSPLPTPLPADEPAVLKQATAYRVHPRDLGDEEILARVRAIREEGLKTEGILDVSCRVNYQSYRKIFLSEHRDLDQTVTWTTAYVYAMARRDEEIKDYYKGFSNLGGIEVLDEVRGGLDAVIRATLQLLDSEQIPPGEYDCVCDPETTGMIVHEAFGHGVEMDMFVKDRALARSCVGGPVASELVTMHDGSAMDEVASFLFDDEGTLASDTVIIDHGILKRGMCDALSAARLGTEPTGNGRRESYERKAYTRMTNTYFEGGTASPEDMIASIDYGFLLENPSSGMEDPKNWGIQCMVNVAREIKNGELTGKIYSPIVLTGYVPDLLKSVTMMSPGVQLAGGGYCGKGYKEWVKVSDGGPYMKARIRLG
ncbi:MAG: TldD/PmbA family protein [Lachnospiraceae bacterium]|nr:TldD/PmbA family protein [Lachnospiraceae bacterium]